MTVCFPLPLSQAATWFAWALMGMQLFQGLFWYCTDPNFGDGWDRHGTKNATENGWEYDASAEAFMIPCESYKDPGTGAWVTRDYEWRNAVYNFDNIGEAFVSIFVLSFEGWADIMFSAMDVPDKMDQQPIKNNNPWYAAYFLIGTAMFSVYLINLFIAIVFDTCECPSQLCVALSLLNSHSPHLSCADLLVKSTRPGGLIMSSDERRWLEYEKRLLNAKPRPVRRPTTPMTLLLYHIARNDHFNAFVMVMIVVNTVAIGLAGSGVIGSGVMQNLNIFFAVAFAVEAVIKIIGLTPNGYFHERGSSFDLLIAISGVVDLFLPYMTDCKDSPVFDFIRALRCFRALRLLGIIKPSRLVLTAVESAMGQLFNVCVMLVLGLFVMTVLGGAIFYSERSTLFKGGQNLYANFRSLYGGLQLMFIISTGDPWAGFLQEALDGVSNGKKPAAVLFFLMVAIFVSFILMNLFVVVVTEAYEVLADDIRSRIELYIPKYRQVWGEFDREGTGTLKTDCPEGMDLTIRLQQLVRKLPEPLGYHGQSFIRLRSKTILLERQRFFRYEFQQVLLGLSAIWLHDLGLSASGLNFTEEVIPPRPPCPCRNARRFSPLIRVLPSPGHRHGSGSRDCDSNDAARGTDLGPKPCGEQGQGRETGGRVECRRPGEFIFLRRGMCISNLAFLF